MIVAQALSDQKLVLDQITALNETTGNLIESTSEMLKQQSAEISKQASEATVDLAKLQKAFQNIYATMDEIDTFKVKALDNMAHDDQLARDRDRQVAHLHQPGAGPGGRLRLGRIRSGRRSLARVRPGLRPKPRSVSPVQRVLRFLTSRKNIGAIILALVAGGLFVARHHQWLGRAGR